MAVFIFKDMPHCTDAKSRIGRMVSSGLLRRENLKSYKSRIVRLSTMTFREIFLKYSYSDVDIFAFRWIPYSSLREILDCSSESGCYVVLDFLSACRKICYDSV
jgi:hypothetical protein